MLLIRHLRHALVVVQHDLRLLQGSLDGRPAAEDLWQLLERPPPRLDVEEVDEGELEDVPEDEQEVVLPAGPGERDAGDEGVVETGDVDPEVVEGHALCSWLVAQTFDGVQLLQGRVAGWEDEAEDKNERDDSFGLAGLLDQRRAAVVGEGLAVGAVP